jgi:hypothetical protein
VLKCSQSKTLVCCCQCLSLLTVRFSSFISAGLLGFIVDLSYFGLDASFSKYFKISSNNMLM